MYCRKCGHENDANAFRCVQCREVVQDLPSRPAETGSRPEVPNHLVLAILATFFCCLPFGIVAIVYASQVNGKLDAGDLAGAEEASRQASLWGWIAFGLGIAVGAGYFILTMIVGLDSR
jgi:hypothetical protein